MTSVKVLASTPQSLLFSHVNSKCHPEKQSLGGSKGTMTRPWPAKVLSGAQLGVSCFEGTAILVVLRDHPKGSHHFWVPETKTRPASGLSHAKSGVDFGSGFCDLRHAQIFSTNYEYPKHHWTLQRRGQEVH